MKGRLLATVFALAGFGLLTAQQPNPDDFASITATATPIDVLSKCDQKLGTVRQPADGPTFLTSSRQFGWFGGAIDLELAQQVHFPQLAPSGQVLEYVAIQSITNGAGTPGEFSFWTDNGGQPGALILAEPVTTQDNLVYQVSDATAATLSSYYGGQLWISFVNISDPNAFIGPRWFWGSTASNTNQANGHPPYYAYFHDELNRFGPDCPKWTNHTVCGATFKSGPFLGLNYELSFCRNAKLNIGTGVPTMTQWGLFIFGLVVLTLGVVALYNYSRQRVRENA